LVVDEVLHDDPELQRTVVLVGCALHACEGVERCVQLDGLVAADFLVDQLGHFGVLALTLAALAGVGLDVVLEQSDQISVQKGVGLFELSCRQDHFDEIPKHQNIVFVMHIFPLRHFVLEIIHVFDPV